MANPCRNISSICWIARRVTSTTVDSLPSCGSRPSVDAARPVDFVELIRAERERRESQQLAGGRSSVE